MLPLDDARWGQMETFFGKPEDLPKVLEEWLAAVGFDQEERNYRELRELFLHQATITNAAFAVVPWLVDVCKKGQTRYATTYLADVAFVEADRLKIGVNRFDKRGVHFSHHDPEQTPWLMSDYHEAIAEASNLADDVIAAARHDESKRELIFLKPALHGNADLAWSQWYAGTINEKAMK